METSAKANINVENVRLHSTSNYTSIVRHQYHNVCFFSGFTGISDTRQRHQIKNGHKIGKKNSLRNGFTTDSRVVPVVFTVVAEPYDIST